MADAGLIGFLALAFAMGLRHGFDADHIALIDGLTRYNAKERPALARRCGMLFTTGHILVVLGLVLVVTYAVENWQTPQWLEISGMLVSVLFLLLIGSVNVIAALRAESGTVVSPIGIKSRFVGRIADRWGVMGVGMLFALSFDTLSQAGLMAIVGARYGVVAPLLAGLAFGTGMFVTAGLTSLWVAHMSGRVDARAASASRLATLVIGLMSLAIATMVGSSLVVSPMGDWLDANGLWLSLSMTGGLAAVFVACLWFFRTSAKSDRII